MPSTEQRWQTAGAILAVATLVYALVIAAQILLGILVAGAIYGTALLVAFVSPDGVVADMGARRAAVTGLVSVGVAAYGVVVASNLLLGVFVALLVFLGSWLTAPHGPLARFVRWLRAARDDLREVRESLAADDHAATDD